jgi:hypothetical protein
MQYLCGYFCGDITNCADQQSNRDIFQDIVAENRFAFTAAYAFFQAIADYNQTVMDSLKRDLSAIFQSNPGCTEDLFGNTGRTQVLLDNMNIESAPGPWVFTTPSQVEMFAAVSSGAHPAGTGWTTLCPTCVGWDGKPFVTYVGDMFVGLAPGMQESILIHEIGHPHTGYGQVMDDSNLYSYGRINELCGTDLPVR